MRLTKNCINYSLTFFKEKAKERHPLHRKHRTLRMNHRLLKCPNTARWMCSLAVEDSLKASTRLVNLLLYKCFWCHLQFHLQRSV